MPKSQVIATCVGCGSKCAIPPGASIRCGKCKRIFTALELQRAALGDRPGIPQDERMLDSDEGWDDPDDVEDDDDGDDWDDDDEEQDREED